MLQHVSSMCPYRLQAKTSSHISPLLRFLITSAVVHHTTSARIHLQNVAYFLYQQQALKKKIKNMIHFTEMFGVYFFIIIFQLLFLTSPSHFFPDMFVQILCCGAVCVSISCTGAEYPVAEIQIPLILKRLWFSIEQRGFRVTTAIRAFYGGRRGEFQWSNSSAVSGQLSAFFVLGCRMHHVRQPFVCGRNKQANVSSSFLYKHVWTPWTLTFTGDGELNGTTP